MYRNPPDHIIKELLTNATTIAIVGASSKPDRASYGIMQRLRQVGYRVIPVNPHESEVLGERAYPSLSEIAEPIDIVDVFRRAEHTPAIADEAVKIGAKALWLQSGIVNEEAAARATSGGLLVIMDACLGTMHSVLRVKREATTLQSPLRAG
jgi:predicted CoA-binding protein